MGNELSLLIRLTALDHLTQPLNRSAKAVGLMGTKLGALHEKGGMIGEVGRNLAVIGAGGTAAVGKTLSAFNELEAAQVGLKNAMFTTAGADKNWAKINQLAIEAGNLYPGTTADFLNLATGMKQMGMDSTTMTSGAFKAAAALQVMFKLDPREAGESYVQMGNAMKIAGKDAEAFADVIQRVSNAGGLKLPEIKEAMKYAGTGLSLLGVDGLDNSKTVLTMMGALRQSNVESSQIGTTFQGAMSHMATMGARLKAGRGEIMREAQAAMSQAGVSLNFFDQQGNFLGMQNFIAQFDKLKSLNQEKRLMLGKALFGEEGSKMALIDSDKMRNMAHRMLEQETLKKRLDNITGTLGNKAEAAQGSFTNLLASIGEKLAPKLAPVLDKLNSLLGTLQGLTDRFPRLTAALAGTTGGLAVAATGIGGSLWIFGKFATGVGDGVTALRTFGRLAWSVGGAVLSSGPAIAQWTRSLALTAGLRFPGLLTLIPATKAFTLATWGSVKALWAQAVAFAATPFGMVTIAVVALIAVGVLLWKSWDKVTAFFKRAWAWFQGAWSKVPGWAKWFMPFISIPMLLIKNWSKIKDVFLSLWGFIKGMSSQFWSAGKNIVKAIWEGMKSLASKPVDAIKNIVGKVRRFLPFSPAKEGPLSDIHKVGGGLLGTITSSLKPSALLAKVQGIAGQVRSVLGGAVSVASNPIGALKAAAGAVGGNHYHFHLTVPPGTTAQQAADLERQLDAILPRLRAKLALATDRQQRGAFA